MFNIYIRRAAELYGVTHTRPIYEKAIELLHGEQCKWAICSYWIVAIALLVIALDYTL